VLVVLNPSPVDSIEVGIKDLYLEAMNQFFQSDAKPKHWLWSTEQLSLDGHRTAGPNDCVMFRLRFESNPIPIASPSSKPAASSVTATSPATATVATPTIEQRAFFKACRSLQK
jgi:hypothetical protein